MGKVKERFQENQFGIIDHSGCVKVAKSNIKATILHINTAENGYIQNVLVKGRKNSYPCQIHKDIRNMMCFVEEGDCAFIKWKNGQSWIVGFQKQKAHQLQIKGVEA